MTQQATTPTKLTLKERKAKLEERRNAMLSTPNALRDQILALDCFNHQKIYLLKTRCELKGSEISALLNTNGGAVGNVLRDYQESKEKREKAASLLIDQPQATA